MAEQEKNSKPLEELLAPAALSIASNYVEIGGKFTRTLFVVTYPRYLNTNWFSPVINLDWPLDISIYVHPEDTGAILKKLRDRLARFEAQVMEDQAAGKVRDPIMETAINDIEDLRDKLQQGTDRFFELGVYITIYGESVKELDETENKIKAILDAQLVYTKEAIFRMKDGFFSTLPLNNDILNVHNSLNTEPISSLFPFVSYDLTSDHGILYGINTHNNSLVLFDRFSLENANVVVFGKSGGGKSIKGTEPVLIKKDGDIKMAKIGPLVEELITKHGVNQIDEELEGVIDPGIEVWSFDKNLKGSWSKVTIAARKKATNYFYRFTTRSGRIITTTGDHNMIILNNGNVEVAKSSEIKPGEYIPLPRLVESSSQPQQFFNLLEIIGNSRGVYIEGAEKIIKENYQNLKKAVLDIKLDRYLYKYRGGQVIPIQYFTKIIKQLIINLNSPELANLKITSRLNLNSLPTFLPINESLAKILGYIVSEGIITNEVVIISNLDFEVVEDIKKCLSSLGILFYITKRGVIIANRPFVEIIKALGGKKKSANKDVISQLFSSEKKIIAAYLRAYFEGDGGVEHASVTAVSKSKNLISNLNYLLYYFGIIGRISETKKSAPGWRWKKTYWRLAISDQDNLKKFADEINFITNRKQKLLYRLVSRDENTNVDVDIIPDLTNIFQEIDCLLPLHSGKFQKLSPLKKGGYRPSPSQLRIIIDKIRQIIDEFINKGSGFDLKLPSLESIIQKGKQDKGLNHKLWQALGHSWQLMKNGKVTPKIANIIKAAKTIGIGFDYSLTEIKDLLRAGFKDMGLTMKYFNPSLQSALISGSSENTSYKLIWDSSQYVSREYQTKLDNIQRLEKLLHKLEVLANGNLFWDPIRRVEKIKNIREKYVYDLTVDNEVFLAGTGGMFIHNSYAVKLEILRSLMFGTQIFIIDPENEYKFLSDSVGGTSVKISIASDDHINPFDLPAALPDESLADVLRSHILNLTGLFKLMLDNLTPEEESILDEAITQTYAIKDITFNSEFKNMIPPLMTDFQNVLEGMTGTQSLVTRLKKYTQGSFSGFLNQPTNVRLDNQLITFSIRDMEEELRPIAMYLVLNYIWTQVRSELRKRLLVVDEAWWLLKYEAGGQFLLNIAKRARKYFLGLTTISQDIPDFMNSPYGKPIVTNSSIQLLLKQSPASIDLVKQTFNLTDAEKFFLLESRVGHGLFFAGQNHVALRVVASYAEDQTITSDPRQILEIEEAKKEFANLSKSGV